MKFLYCGASKASPAGQHSQAVSPKTCVGQVSRVLYPGLTSNPYYPRVQKLFGGQAGGVVTFELLAGAAAAEMMFQVCSGTTMQLSWMCTKMWGQDVWCATVPKQRPGQYARHLVFHLHYCVVPAVGQCLVCVTHCSSLNRAASADSACTAHLQGECTRM